MLVRHGIKINEDELTRSVFGLLRYLPPSLWLKDFIDELRRLNPIALPALDTSSQPKVVLWPSYPIPKKDEWKKCFWRPESKRSEAKTPKGSISPDAQIETETWLMFIESEYSKDLEAEQMFQQFAIASRECGEKDFFILLINKSLTRPSHCGVYSEKLNKPQACIQPDHTMEQFISQCCTESLKLTFSAEDVNKRFLWINWQSIQGILINLSIDQHNNISIPMPFQYMIKTMRDDVCDLLEKENLTPITFNLSEYLAECSIEQDAIPYSPVIEPVIRFLSSLEIKSARIPRYNVFLDIQTILKPTQLLFSCLPEPFSRKKN